MTATMPDPNFRLDDFGKTCLNEHADGFRAGILWLATHPPRHEVACVARIWRELHDGGVTACDTTYHNADDFSSFIDFLRGGPYELYVFDGVKEMAEVNASQGTSYAPWPKRAFAVSFDSTYVLGFGAACNTAIKMGGNR